MSEVTTAWLLIEVGCAECRGLHDECPLVRIVSAHGSEADAKAAGAALFRGGDMSWSPHPQGGEFYGFGSGDVWVAPIAAFTTPNTDAKWDLP